MRHYRQLTIVEGAPEGGLAASSQDDFGAGVLIRREGDYVALSFYSGAVELLLRLKTSELVRTLDHLHPTDQTRSARSVGTSHTTLWLTLRPDGSLVIRPSLTTDAAGSISLNFELAESVKDALNNWLKQ